MKIAIVVQGRFHAFDLGRALMKRGHDVLLFTNYPKWAAARFRFPRERVRSFGLHGALSKVAYRISDWTRYRPEKWLNPWFGRWADKELARFDPDVIHAWSGVSQELLANTSRQKVLKLVMRGSAHIRTQADILKAEELRTGVPIDRPDEWMRRREEAEYLLADRVVVLSRFAYDSFCAQGFDVSRLRLLELGANTEAFYASPEVIAARCRRILSGAPLQVMYTGNLSFQKGMRDLAEMARALRGSRLRFRLIGRLMAEVRDEFRGLEDVVEIVSRQPQSTLPFWYARGDLYVFPTLQDGFPAVLAQAKASGLLILTTPNSSGPDIIREDEDGWILPIRKPEAFVEKLLWCDANRSLLAAMVRSAYAAHRSRNWDDVAADFEALCFRELSAFKTSQSGGDGSMTHG